MNEKNEQNERTVTVIEVCDNPIYGIHIGHYDEATFGPLTPEQWFSEVWAPLQRDEIRAYCESMGYDAEVRISHSPARDYGDPDIIDSVRYHCEQNWVDWLKTAIPSATEPSETAANNEDTKPLPGVLRSLLLTLTAIAATVAIVSIPV